MAIGASRAAVVRQLLTESLVLAVGETCGISRLLGVTFLRIPIPSIPASLGIGMDMRLLAFSTVVSLVTASLLIGAALRATRGISHRHQSRRKRAGADFNLRGLTGRNVLVTAQLALSVVLLVISADFIRGFQAAWRIDPGPRGSHPVLLLTRKPAAGDEPDARLLQEADRPVSRAAA
jgi:hypothetical protein